MAVWVHIQRLLIKLYSDVFLKRICNTLGKFLKVDKLTSLQSRGMFARICIELDLEKPLVPHFYVRSYKLNIEYKGIRAICFQYAWEVWS